MKLEIGAGNGNRQGFIHTDLNLISGHHVEVVCRGEQLPFVDGCFDEVYMLGVFEHFTQSNAHSLICECSRVLCIGGIIEFTFPDLVAVCRIIVEDTFPDSWNDYFRNRWKPLDYALSCLYGGQDRPGQIHQWGWTLTTVEQLLQKYGIAMRDFDRSVYEPDTHYRVIGQKL